MYTLTRNNGFTLVEMLVVIVLLSMMSIVGYQSVVFVVKRWEAGEKIMSYLFNNYQSLGVLRQKLGALEKIKYEVDGGVYYSFAGESDRVRFVTRFENANQAGLYICEIVNDGSKDKVYLHYGLRHPDIGLFTTMRLTNKTMMFDDNATISFQYYGSKHGEGSRWYSNWISLSVLPRMIHAKVDMKNRESLDLLIYVEASGT